MIVYVKNSKTNQCYEVDLCDLPRSLVREIMQCDSLVSIGLTTEHDRGVAWDVINSGAAVEISYEEWNHSGCLSSYILHKQTKYHW